MKETKKRTGPCPPSPAYASFLSIIVILSERFNNLATASMNRFCTFVAIFLTLYFLTGGRAAFSQAAEDTVWMREIDQEVFKAMDEGKIPGLSLVIVNGEEEVIRSYGYARIATKVPVSPTTLFELGSCSKAFTALALTKLEQQQQIDLDRYVSEYLPWFCVTYQDSAVEVTVRQVMHHTSGIPWSTIAKIPQSNADDALEQTVRQLIGQELDELPGEEYHYATVNYDILALIMETVTNQTFEEYLQKNVINALNLEATSVGVPSDSAAMATGYKIGFLAPRAYHAPIYRGNNAAGYVISNAEDMARWLKIQMGLTGDSLEQWVSLTHQRDETVPLHDMAAYARGWEVSLDGTGEVFHRGLNPNFSSYVAMRANDQLGVVVLANSNSNYTDFLGNKVMKMLADKKIERAYRPDDGLDKMYSSIFLVCLLYILVVLGFIGKIFVEVSKGTRALERVSGATLGRLVLPIIFITLFVGSIYWVPAALGNLTWKLMLVWSPVSLVALIGALSVAVSVSYVAYVLGTFFPHKNLYRRKVPIILLVSLLSGSANVAVIVMVTSVIGTDVKVVYLMSYYGFIVAVYLLGRKFVQISLIKLTRSIVYDLQVHLIDKIISTSYEKFEKIERGRIYTALNDDVNTIGQSTSLLVTLITSVITAVGVFLYLASLAFWATVLTVLLVVTISATYYLVSESTNRYFEKARDSRDVFMGLINGMIEGFKELSLHRNKKRAYRDEVAVSANEYQETSSVADIRFVNAFLVGESSLVILLGVVSIGMPVLFPHIELNMIMSFVIILLYLIGPVNAILDSVPVIMNIRIAWKRVTRFTEEIPANQNLTKTPEAKPTIIEKIEARGIGYRYRGEDQQETFGIGPIDLEIYRGELLFIIGGNGSGKTTLAKLLTGLYEPTEGKLMVNNQEVTSAQAGEYFSTVFSPSHLFKKLYSIDVASQEQELQDYLTLLDLGDKVEVVDNEFSTINLSGGQRKRLALLQCYLEDSPIYLFDEWAADQDPEYRNFFYRTLLPEMKQLGKIVIAITHDDQYFDVADKVVKMNRGQLESYSGENIWVTL